MATAKVAQDAAQTQFTPNEPTARDDDRFVSLLAALAAAWVAAGSTGLLGHALRGALTLLLLGTALFSGFPGATQSPPWIARSIWKRGAMFAAILGAILALVSSSIPAVNVMASALVLAVLAGLRPASTPFLVAATAVTVLGLWRFAVTHLPWLWLVADQLSAGVAFVGGLISQQPLKAGMTYAGLDYLVLMLAMGSIVVVRMTGPVPRRVGTMLAVVLGAHLIYLVALSFVPRVLADLPATKLEPVFGQKTPWAWENAVRSLLPWNVPSIALLLHLAGAAWLFRKLGPAAPGATGADGPATQSAGTPRQGRQAARRPGRFPAWARVALPIALALLLPALASLNTQPLSLAGKKVTVHEKGFLNWMKPKHGEYGRLSVGMYGMLPEFLQSYGATCVVSPELSAADLQGADLLVLIFPNEPWAAGQLDRIWNFVREGGSLLVLGEHTVEEKEGGNRFNDVLAPTAMRVAFDSAMFEVGGWLESYEVLSHPATAGLRDFRNDFGVVIGASVEARWPARPVLAGRFGFAEPGDKSNDESKGGSMMGNHKYDAGEKLGDPLLAAEQRFGRGRVMVFGDTSGFSNSILYGSHDFVARLYAYLCSPAQIASGRVLAASLGGIALILLLGLFWRDARSSPGAGAGPGMLTGTALALAIGLAWTDARNHRAAHVLPDGRPPAASAAPAAPAINRLAYIDTSHLLRSSDESWREDGLGGLGMTLMRNGYLVLGLDEFERDRIDRAGLLLSAAPSRPFGATEIDAVETFVVNGGIFICTVGWPEAGASRKLLARLGFYVGGIGAATTGQPEPKPFGHFKAPYFNGCDYMAYVRFHAAWHVESHDPQARPIAYGPRDPKGPPDQPDPSVILMRRIGRGKAVVVADTAFATNKNLEREGGEPFEGMRENADFWRWLLDYLNDRPPWTPPKPATTGITIPPEAAEMFNKKP